MSGRLLSGLSVSAGMGLYPTYPPRLSAFRDVFKQPIQQQCSLIDFPIKNRHDASKGAFLCRNA